MSQVAEQSTLAAAFESFRPQSAFNAGGLGAVREAAFQRFTAAGFPSTRNEEWQHTNNDPNGSTEFGLPSTFEIPGATAEPFLFAGELSRRVVLVNGRWSPALSSLDALPAGVTVPASATRSRTRRRSRRRTG
jgi:Fe-S cluster assembly protein SufD